MEQSSWACGEGTASHLRREVVGGASCRSINRNTPPGDETVGDDATAGVWWDIDLCDEKGDGGKATAAMEIDRQTFSLSPLTVGPSLLPRAPSIDVHAVLFPSTAGGCSPTKLSPLLVKGASAAPCRRPACGVISNGLDDSATIPLTSSSSSDSAPVVEQSGPSSPGGCPAG
ncbi:unnamed protein product, partial [Ectocarpus fasciculatus]